MKLFRCQNCAQLLYFENTHCERCSYRLGYLPARATLSALDPADDHWQTLATPAVRVRFCDNAGHGICNWLIDPADASSLCEACRYNRTIPDLTVEANLARWQRLEAAKHWLFYSLLRL